MKFSTVCLSLLSFFVIPATSIVISPEGEGDCWGSTFEIIKAEIGAVFNVELYNTRRTYILCPGTITVGDIPFGSAFPVGGDFPLIIVNKNVHILCEDPGTCVLSGGGNAAALLTNVHGIRLIETFLGALGQPPPPVGYYADSSNLLVEGVTFSDAAAPEEGNKSIILMHGQGLNMVLDKCAFTNNNHEKPPESLLLALYLDPPLGGEELRMSITFRNSVVEDNTFQYGIVATLYGNLCGCGVQPPLPEGIDFEVTFDNSVITNNVIEGWGEGGYVKTEENDPYAYDRPGLFTVFSTRINLVSSSVVTNALGRASAVFNLEHFSELAVSEDSIIENINISETIEPSCDGALTWVERSTAGECIPLANLVPTPTPTSPLTPAPVTASPVTPAPVRTGNGRKSGKKGSK